MNARRWFRHGIALLLGAALAAVMAHHPSSGTMPLAGAEQNLRGHRAHVEPLKASPRELLAALAETRMSMVRRQAMKQEIYRDWAQSDPHGLLNYLNKRAWPVFSGYQFDRVFIELSRQQPHTLPAYARAYGCQDAMEAIGHGDPRVALAIVQAEMPGGFRDGFMRDLFERGEQNDPEFHLKIAEISDPEAKSEAINGAAQVMLANRRYDDFFNLLAEEREFVSPEGIGGAFASVMVSSGRVGDLNRMESLPEEVRTIAVKEQLEMISSDMIFFGKRVEDFNGEETLRRLLLPHQVDISEEYRLGTMRVLLNHGWHEGMETEISRAIAGGDFGIRPNEELAVEWKKWALELPGTDDMESIREAAISRWIKIDKDKVCEIDQLPSQRLRDTAYYALVSGEEGEFFSDDARHWVEKIQDPVLREKATRLRKPETPSGK